MKRFKWKPVIAIVLALSLLTAPVLAADGTSVLLTKLESLMEIIQANYYKDVKVSDLIDGAIKGMFSALDKHSTYFTPEEYKDFKAQIYGEFGGLGIYIEKKDDYIQVVSPIEDTPAYRAGIQTGDVIMYVNGQDIKGYSTEKAAAIMKGQPGTKVKIGIKREGVNEIIYLELTRELIKIKSVKYEILPDNIGYIRLTEFNGQAYDSISKAINEFKAKNVKGVVIDVRDNPGGQLGEVVNICKLLIPKGPIVHIDYKNLPTETYYSELAKAPFEIVMLVNEGSASASEIMAAAVKESGAGILVGATTYGKGTVQSIQGFADGSGIKLTTANYLTPKEHILDGVGIIPDFEVQNTSIDSAKDFAQISGERSIKYKLIGLDVLGVQQRLKALGYGISAADGIFGRNTLAAVQKFQKDNNLKVDGSIDSDDIKVLNDKFNAASGSKDAQMDRALIEIKKMIGNN
jgi:carboxyl-terminal processing protease